MDTITYSQVQELVNRLPSKKLQLAYSLLVDLADKEAYEISPQIHFMLLPSSERRRIMSQQAEQMVAHYEQEASERQTWQAGDFDEY